jgi:hypothetical protein
MKRRKRNCLYYCDNLSKVGAVIGGVVIVGRIRNYIILSRDEKEFLYKTLSSFETYHIPIPSVIFSFIQRKFLKKNH